MNCLDLILETEGPLQVEYLWSCIKAASAGGFQGSAVTNGLWGLLRSLWGGRCGLSEPESPGTGQVGDQHAEETRKRLELRPRSPGATPYATKPPITNSPLFLLICPWQGRKKEAGPEFQTRRPTPVFLIVAGQRGPGPSTSPEDETPPPPTLLGWTGLMLLQWPPMSHDQAGKNWDGPHGHLKMGLGILG